MTLFTSSTGSYPPLYDDLESGIAHLPIKEQDQIVRESIERAIRDQIEIGIDVLVDGQARDDIVSVFTRKLPGYARCEMPCRIIGPVKPADEAITARDYEYAKGLAGDRQLKAHLTGPLTLARSSQVDPASGYASRDDPRLIRDLALALSHEGRRLVQSGAKIVQIDEPALVNGADLSIALSALKTIIDVAEIPFAALHACGDVTQILHQLLFDAPVQMISLEGDCLNNPELSDIDRQYLGQCQKQIGLGCIRTDVYDVEHLSKLQNFLDRMVARLGEDGIWAIMPNCGLRTVPYDVARRKLSIMVAAARSLR